MHERLQSSTLAKYSGLVALYVFGPLFISTTDPEKLALPLLVVPFLWLFSVLFMTSWLLLKRVERVNRRQAAMVSGVIASIPVLLVVFQSIHQLSVRDVILSIGLVVIAAIYMIRADFIR